MEQKLYYEYSQYLKEKYGEKVYKLPINLPISCPNRIDGIGCFFCAEQGTGFEAAAATVPVAEQLESVKKVIQKKYHANKFIAYFQNYTNTFMPLEVFTDYIKAAAAVPDIVEIAISTRPDCVREDYLSALDHIHRQTGLQITIELGLQTVNYRTLEKINRGHGLAEYLDAVRQIQTYGFAISTHVILNLPGDDITDSIETAKVLSALHIDTVKIHSLYIAKNTVLCQAYENGTISLCSKAEYFRRLIAFLEHLSPDIAVERLFSRIPKEDAVFSNWNTSWWKLKDELLLQMEAADCCQGRLFHYLNGHALGKLPREV